MYVRVECGGVCVRVVCVCEGGGVCVRVVCVVCRYEGVCEDVVSVCV